MNVQNQKIIAVVPVKPLNDGKSRLIDVLSERQRQALSLMLLNRVINCVKGVKDSIHLWIVGGDATVQALCAKHGVVCLNELGDDLNSTLYKGFQKAFEINADVAMYIPADLPMLETQDLTDLIHSSEGLSRLVLCQAESDGGTNALLVPKDMMAFMPQLGDNSFLKHIQIAQVNSWRFSFCNAPGMTFDLDTPRDFDRCKQELPLFMRDLDQWTKVLNDSLSLSTLDALLSG